MLPESGIDIDQVVYGKKPLARDPARQLAIDTFKPVPPGSNTSAAIVLVSDGEGNTGPELQAAAKFAAERGVRVYTVGVGTRDGRGALGGRLVDARAPGRGRPEKGRRHHPRRIWLPRRQCE